MQLAGKRHKKAKPDPYPNCGMGSMFNNDNIIRVEYTFEFKRNIRQLAKKYRHIKADVKPVSDQHLAGETPGDQVTGTG